MSGAVIGASSAAATAAAAAHKRRMEEEEEKLTNYSVEDLDGWEFKIVRTSTRKFKHPEAIRRLREEEARAGWEMVEKFDDYRIRFKRRVEQRYQDPHRAVDPYRSHIGPSEVHIVMIVLGICALGALALLLALGVLR